MLRPSSPVTSRRQHGFTLVELLTVIAIIGILASVLIPTVNGVRRASQRSTCVANIRDVGACILSYVSDNKGKLPGPILQTSANTYSMKDSGGTLRYDTDTYPHVGNVLGKYLNLPPPPVGEKRYAPQLLCPAWHAAVGGKEADDTREFVNETWRAAEEFGKSGTGSKEPKYKKPQMLNIIEKPAQHAALFELDGQNHKSSKMPLNYHGNATRTYLYFDGHVELESFIPNKS